MAIGADRKVHGNAIIGLAELLIVVLFDGAFGGGWGYVGSFGGSFLDVGLVVGEGLLLEGGFDFVDHVVVDLRL